MPDLTASPGRAPPGPMPNNNQGSGGMQQRQGGNNVNSNGGVKEPVLLQGDFRKVSGISSEIFRQIEAVENDHDPSTAAALEVSFLNINCSKDVADIGTYRFVNCRWHIRMQMKSAHNAFLNKSQLIIYKTSLNTHSHSVLNCFKSSMIS